MRRLLERRRRARARVQLVQQPRTDYAAGGGIGSKQVAEVTLPRAELDRVWSAEHLERLARTYWRFLTRVSLGLLRVLYTENSREVVLLTRPFVLLRFDAPQLRHRAGRRHGHLADRPRPAGGRRTAAARASSGSGVRRRPAAEGDSEATVVVTSEVVNFYPRSLFARIGRFIYNQTQLRIHVIVTNAFLRSLANLDLEPSVVGALSPGARPRSPAASPDRGER